MSEIQVQHQNASGSSMDFNKKRFVLFTSEQTCFFKLYLEDTHHSAFSIERHLWGLIGTGNTRRGTKTTPPLCPCSILVLIYTILVFLYRVLHFLLPPRRKINIYIYIYKERE